MLFRSKSQTDLLYADATNLKNLTKQAIGGKVNFPFKHALSRIGFKVQAMVDLVNTDGTGTSDNGTTGNGTIDDNTKIVITKVELIGKFYPSGTLNLNNTDANAPSWTPSTATSRIFELTTTNNNFLSTVDYGETNYQTKGQLVASGTAKQTLNNNASYIMVIPQKFDGNPEDNKIKIRVTYDVITTDTNLETGQSKITNVIESTPFLFDFQHGKAYTFNLHLGMTSVKFDASVTDWSVVTPETVVNVPINN